MDVFALHGRGMNLNQLSAGTAGLGFVFTFLGGGMALATDFYVATNGADANPGTRSKPFASFERARDEVRKLSQSAGDITVWVRGGDYARTNAFELTAADSGSSNAPITWRAYPNEKPRFLGGRRLSGFGPVTDPAVLARLPESARTHVLQLDLRALGIRDYGQMRSRGFARPTTPAHCELFCAGKPMTLARWPNEGEWERIAGSPEATAQNDGHGGKIGRLEEGFFYHGDRPRGWKDTPMSGSMGIGHGIGRTLMSASPASIPNSASLKRRRRTASMVSARVSAFYFLNVLEELDQPGEWFLDRAGGRIYFWPPTLAFNPANSPQVPNADASEILLSLLDQPLVKLTGVSHVTFRGFTLEAARGNAVEIRGGSGNRIAGCIIRNIGDWGVTIEGGSGHTVVGCDIFDTGDGGVSLHGGDRKTLQPGESVVENCHFARQGRWSKCYVPAVLIGGVGMRASHNLIHDHPHCAILFNGNDHLIEFNEIHHIALETGDVGAIYTGRDYTYRGNRIRHNFIHHTGGVGMGSMGVYMDDCVSGTEIYGNIFYKVHRAAFLGGGRDHQVINNIFVECDPAVELDGRGLDHLAGVARYGRPNHA